MQEIIDVDTGDIAVRVLVIGSCIAVAAYDPKTINFPGVIPYSIEHEI